MQLSEEANAFVNFNMRQQNRPKSTHDSATRNLIITYPKSFPLPHTNYPAPPDNDSILQFPVLGAIREAMNKNIMSGLSTVRPISAPANRRNGNALKAPTSNVPSIKRPKSAGRYVAERFKEELTMSYREDAHPLHSAFGKLDNGDMSAQIAPNVSVLKSKAATIATVAATKICKTTSTQKKSELIDGKDSVVITSSSSMDPKDRIMISTEDKGKRGNWNMPRWYHLFFF